MPAITLQQYDPDNRTLNELGDKERTDRAKDIDTRWRWYYGAHPDVLKVVQGQVNDNVKLNLCGRGTDRLLEFIGRPTDLVVDTDAPDAEDSAAAEDDETVTPEQQVINDVYAVAIKPILPEMQLVTLVAGHSFIRVWVDENGDIQAAGIDPKAVSVYWNAGTGSQRQPLFYRIQWTDGDKAYRQDIVPRWLQSPDPQFDQDSTWDVYEFEGKGAKWNLTGETNLPETFCPIIELRNKVAPFEYYGQTQLSDDVCQLNNAVNFLSTNTARIIRYHAHPRTIGEGVDAAKVNVTSIEGFFTVPEGAKVYNLEMQSDLASSMAMLQQLKGEFFATMRVTDVSSIKDRIGQITNFGVRMLHSDMLEQVEERRDVWGRAIGALALALAKLTGSGIDRAPLVTWPETIPQSRLEVLQAAQLEQALGIVSRETLADDLGRDYPTEKARMDGEKQESDEAIANTLSQVVERGGFTSQPAANGQRVQ